MRHIDRAHNKFLSLFCRNGIVRQRLFNSDGDAMSRTFCRPNCEWWCCRMRSTKDFFFFIIIFQYFFVAASSVRISVSNHQCFFFFFYSPFDIFRSSSEHFQINRIQWNEWRRESNANEWIPQDDERLHEESMTDDTDDIAIKITCRLISTMRPTP